MEEKIKYEILSPDNMIENKAEDALKFALENEKIKNIAITGQYSSGKSSMIQSYFEKYVNKKDYLDISLATFEKNEKDNNSSEKSNLLEKIIIEKLYYSVLKKYDKQENIKSSAFTGIIVLFINMAIYLFYMESINNSLKTEFWITLIFIMLEIICLTIAIGWSISYLINLQKIKLKLGDIEVEVNQNNGEEKNRNLLSEEIDVIVKTMNIAKYKYVIFEDLDRFQNPKIFERLRDLNITLNITLKQKVKFIYVLRDEIFIADNRTKFFDFIIPVVPYVSYENSGEELLKIIKKHNLEDELSEDFILDISLYISDIRILKNTVNEYLMYKKTLDKTLPNYEKLFSILLYKNTCSKDFAELQNKNGIVYGCFKSKDENVSKYVEQIQEKIEKKNEEYKELEKNLISKNNIKELAIYLIRKSVSNGNSITIRNKKYSDKTIQYGMNVDTIEDDMLFSSNTTIEYYNTGWKTENLLDFFRDKCPNFFEQYKVFKEGVENLKEKISIELEKLNNEIDKSKEYTLSELMQEDDNSVNIELNEYSDLIKYLLSHGYIDENYNTYINKFHEGSITEKDYNFIMNVKNRKNNDFKEKLDNSVKIIKRLKSIEFKKENILNIDILDTLLDHKDFLEKKKIYINTLIKSNRYINLIKYCICESKTFKNKKVLLINLCNKDKDILKKVQEAKIEQRYKNLLIEEIIINVDINRLKELNYINEIVKYIEENNLLKNAKLECITDKIIGLDIKYYNICEFRQNVKLYKYIIDNNKYIINYNNIYEIFINEDSNNKNKIEQENYYLISTNEKLNKYVEENIQYYITNVYIALENKQNNPETSIINLLNNLNINNESKQNIIAKETNKIQDILQIKDDNLWKYILKNNLIKIEWNNINSYYEKFGLDEELIRVFNDEYTRNTLLKHDTKIDNEINLNFVKDLLLSNNLNENAYFSILDKVEYKLVNEKITELEKNKLQKLIELKKIEINLKMINNIRDYSTEMFILFIKFNYKAIHKLIDNGTIILNLDEINEVLKSDVTSNIKFKCIGMISDEESENVTKELAENISSIVVNNNFKEILSESLLLKITKSIQNTDKKVKLLNLNFKTLNKDNIKEYLENLDENYTKIVINRTSPTLKNTEANIELLENIKGLGYKIKYDADSEEIKLKNTIRYKKEKGISIAY